MQNGVLDENGKEIGKIREATKRSLSSVTAVLFGMNVCRLAISPIKNILFQTSRKRNSWRFLSVTQGKIVT